MLVATLSSATWPHFFVAIGFGRGMMALMKTAFIKIRLEPEVKEAFDRAAKAEGKTASEILRSTIARWVKRNKEPTK
jgi:hypothetical protein